MKGVFYLYRDFTQMLGKHRAYIKPTVFEDAFHFASNGLFDEYYGNTKEYRPGKPLPRVAYQITTAVNDALQPFLREVIYGRDPQKIEALVSSDDRKAPYLPLGANGRFSLPADCVHPTSMLVGKAAVEVLDDNEVGTVLTSLIDIPARDNPKAEVVPGGYQLHPADCDEVVVKYLGRPKRIVYALDYDAADELVYNDKKSVDTDWPEARYNQLLTRMLQYSGLPLRDGQVQQTAQALTDRGA